MTRDFKKQRRDDVRPSSRNYSSGRYGDERSPRPARPRLNRSAVDRGWETGAQQNHADYRPRSRNNDNAGQPGRDYGRPDRQLDRSPAQYGRNTNGHRPYENRQGNYRHDDRAPESNRGPRSRSYDSGRRNFDEPRYGERRGHQDRTGRQGERGERRDYREHAQYADDRPNSRDRDHSRDYAQRGYPGANRQRREFDRNDRSPRSYDRYDRNYRPEHGDSRRNAHNPRWQSRPQGPREHYARQPRRYTNEATPEDELYEGDYESFNTSQAPRHRAEQQRPYKDNTEQTEERHVTRLPDGRVLKGPRRVQRKNAEFWTDVSQETGALVSHVQPKRTPPEVAREEVPRKRVKAVPGTPPKKSAQPKAATTAKPPARKASQVARTRKSRDKKGSSGAGAAVPRPSQRGFKWPRS
ncbi:MAG TPA: hypothetical protein VKV20_08810 [Ktedonobacteraceae bacterium]|jgi:hypothetical protein|nr:hypothetical protein [Ktedonobacteraceae bacterium]